MIVFLVAAGVMLAPCDLPAQTQAQTQEAPQAAAKRSNIPLRVQAVMSRYQGEKKISSVPYTLSVNAVTPPVPGRASQLRMGSSVAIMSPNTVGGEKPTDGAATGAPTAGRSFNYRDIGTQIDCSATSTEDGRFELNIAIEDNSIYVDDEVVKGVSKANDPPIFRRFRSSNQVILRDGQSTQFTAATDRINGEVIRVDVTLNVIK